MIIKQETNSRILKTILEKIKDELEKENPDRDIILSDLNTILDLFSNAIENFKKKFRFSKNKNDYELDVIEIQDNYETSFKNKEILKFLLNLGITLNNIPIFIIYKQIEFLYQNDFEKYKELIKSIKNFNGGEK